MKKNGMEERMAESGKMQEAMNRLTRVQLNDRYVDERGYILSLVDAPIGNASLSCASLATRSGAGAFCLSR